MDDGEIRLTWRDIVSAWRSLRRPSPETVLEQKRLFEEHMRWGREHPEELRRAFGAIDQETNRDVKESHTKSHQKKMP